MERLTEEEIAGIEAQSTGAKAAPWEVVEGADERKGILDANGCPVAILFRHEQFVVDACNLLPALLAELRAAREECERFHILRPLKEWHEDDGYVLWWTYPVSEPPYFGDRVDEVCSTDGPEPPAEFSALLAAGNALLEVRDGCPFALPVALKKATGAHRKDGWWLIDADNIIRLDMDGHQFDAGFMEFLINSINSAGTVAETERQLAEARKAKTIAQQYHDGDHARSWIEDELEGFLPDADFSIGRDWYDNSLEIYLDSTGKLPDAVSQELADFVISAGFSCGWMNWPDATEQHFYSEDGIVRICERKQTSCRRSSDSSIAERQLRKTRAECDRLRAEVVELSARLKREVLRNP